MSQSSAHCSRCGVAWAIHPGVRGLLDHDGWIRWESVQKNLGWGRWHVLGVNGHVQCGSRIHSGWCQRHIGTPKTKEERTAETPPLVECCRWCKINVGLEPKPRPVVQMRKDTLRNLQRISQHPAALRKWVFMAETLLGDMKVRDYPDKEGI